MRYIPNIIETNLNQERIYDLYSRLLKERIILLTGEIDDAAASLICAQLLYLSSQSKDDIQMYINSPGGNVYAGLAIYDTMQYINCDISCVCMGIAASMGAVLLCAGTKGKRLALPHSEVMIHQPLGGMKGQASDMEIAAKHILSMKTKLNEILAKHTGQDIERIKQDCDRDFFMSAVSAKEYGLVDDVVTKK